MLEWTWFEAPAFGKQYLYLNEKVTFEKAKSRCLALGGQLLQIESAFENNFIWSIIRENANRNLVWLGLVNQVVTDKDEYRDDGRWRKLDGSVVHYKQDWDSLPTDAVNALMNAVNGNWEILERFNEEEGYSHTFVCEKSLIEAANAIVTKEPTKATTVTKKEQSNDSVIIRELALIKQKLDPISKIMEKLDKLEARMDKLEMKIKEKEMPNSDLIFETFH